MSVTYSLEDCKRAGCGAMLELDNCDGDLDSYGRQICYEGSTMGVRCSGCGEWHCNDHYNKVEGYCVDCLEAYEASLAGTTEVERSPDALVPSSSPASPIATTDEANASPLPTPGSAMPARACKEAEL